MTDKTGEIKKIDEPSAAEDAAEASESAENSADVRPAEKAPRRPIRCAKPISVILSILLTLLMLAASMLGVVRMALSREGISKLVSGLDIGALLSGAQSVAPPEKDAAAVPGGYVFASAGADGNFPDGILNGDVPDLDKLASGNIDAIADYIYDVCGEDVLAENNITRDSLSEILERSTVSEFVSKKLSDAAETFLDTGSVSVVSGDMIIELIRENEDLIEEVTGTRISEEQYSKLSDKFAKNSFSFEITPEHIKELTGVDAAKVASTVSGVVSPAAYFSVIAAAVLISAVILALHKFLFGRGLPYIAVPAVVCGVFLFAFSALIHVAAGAVMGGAAAGAAAVINTAFVVRAAVFAGSGLVLIIASIPLRRFNV